MQFDPNHPHTLAPLPPPLEVRNHPHFQEFMHIHNEAQKEVSCLNGIVEEMDYPNILLNLFYLKESISSHTIESIYTTLESALEDELKPEQERRPANVEALHYKRAVRAGLDNMKYVGLSHPTIKAIRRGLQIPGSESSFRHLQNKIVNQKSDGRRIVLYTPPKSQHIDQLLANWAHFVQERSSFFPLLKVAIAHYQFEAIHPFEDGNGRVGRILILLQLIQEKMLASPVLFISHYLYKFNDHYKAHLLNVTKTGDWWEYIEFMLKGFSQQAIETKNILLKIKKEKQKTKERLYNSNDLNIKRGNISDIIHHIFCYPITLPTHMAQQTNIHWQTCSKYLSELERHGILQSRKIGRYKFYRNKNIMQFISTP